MKRTKRPKKKSAKITVKDGTMNLSLVNMSFADLLLHKKKRIKKSDDQLKNQFSFGRASRSAAKMLQNPKVKAEFAAGITPTKRTAHLVATVCCQIPPKIIYINCEKYSGNIGDVILVKAIDSFKVSSVSVTIFVNDKRLEQGHAEPYPRKPKLWRYFASAENSSLTDTVFAVCVVNRAGRETQTVQKNTPLAE